MSGTRLTITTGIGLPFTSVIDIDNALATLHTNPNNNVANIFINISSILAVVIFAVGDCQLVLAVEWLVRRPRAIVLDFHSVIELKI